MLFLMRLETGSLLWRELTIQGTKHNTHLQLLTWWKVQKERPEAIPTCKFLICTSSAPLLHPTPAKVTSENGKRRKVEQSRQANHLSENIYLCIILLTSLPFLILMTFFSEAFSEQNISSILSAQTTWLLVNQPSTLKPDRQKLCNLLIPVFN